MGFNQGLAERLRVMVRKYRNVTERKMFGGLAFMLNNNMFIGITGDRLMARIGPAVYPEALNQPHVSEMDFTGKPMKGYVYIAPAGYESDQDLERWVTKCVDFVASLPPK